MVNCHGNLKICFMWGVGGVGGVGGGGGVGEVGGGGLRRQNL